MLTDQELMRLHVEALFTHDEHLRLLGINEPTGPVYPAPRFFLGRTREGAVCRFRSDLPEALTQQLEALCHDELAQDLREEPRHLEAYLRLLETHAPVKRIWMGPAFRFTADIAPPSTRLVAVTTENAHVLREKLAEWVPDVPYCRPFFAVVREDRAVSLCCSVRITPRAHAAGVETLRAYRGRGYAPDVVAGWAREVRKIGCIPLYSTSWENTASQSVARKLGLVAFGVDFHVT